MRPGSPQSSGNVKATKSSQGSSQKSVWGAEEALAEGRGVCQDHAHVFISAARELGVPARYVSGYLHPKAEAQIGETVSGESHAWIEAWETQLTITEAYVERHTVIVAVRSREVMGVVALEAASGEEIWRHEDCHDLINGECVNDVRGLGSLAAIEAAQAYFEAQNLRRKGEPRRAAARYRRALELWADVFRPLLGADIQSRAVSKRNGKGASRPVEVLSHLSTPQCLGTA